MIDMSVPVHLETVNISKKQNSSTAPVTLLCDWVGVDNTLLDITRDKSPLGYHPECEGELRLTLMMHRYGYVCACMCMYVCMYVHHIMTCISVPISLPYSLHQPSTMHPRPLENSQPRIVFAMRSDRCRSCSVDPIWESRLTCT
jgi:hypothetical protein